MNPKTNTPKNHPANATAPQRLPFFRRADVLIISILALVGIVWLIIMLSSPKGSVAVVTVTQGTQQHTEIIPLDANATINIDANLPTTLEVQNGAIRFINSQCPDHTCEGFGLIRNEGEWALCAPAGVLVSIQENG